MKKLLILIGLLSSMASHGAPPIVLLDANTNNAVGTNFWGYGSNTSATVAGINANHGLLDVWAASMLPANLQTLNTNDAKNLTNIQSGALPAIPASLVPSSLQTLNTNDAKNLTNVQSGALPGNLQTLNTNDAKNLTNIQSGALPAIPASLLPSSLQTLNTNDAKNLTNVQSGALPAHLQTLNTNDAKNLTNVQGGNITGPIPTNNMSGFLPAWSTNDPSTFSSGAGGSSTNAMTLITTNAAAINMGRTNGAQWRFLTGTYFINVDTGSTPALEGVVLWLTNGTTVTSNVLIGSLESGDEGLNFWVPLAAVIPPYAKYRFTEYNDTGGAIQIYQEADIGGGSATNAVATIQSAGVPIASAVTTLNFQSGATVTDVGAGQVNVTIQGGSVFDPARFGTNASGQVTLTNRIATLADGATITANCAVTNRFTMTLAASASRTLTVSGNPGAGQTQIWEVINGGNSTITLDTAVFRFATNTISGITGITLNTNAGAIDMFTTYFDGTKYRLVGFAPGF